MYVVFCKRHLMAVRFVVALRLPMPGSGMAWSALTCSFSLIDYFMGISWFFPSTRLVLVLKAPGEQKHTLSASRFLLDHHALFCISLL
jgi:hypothetical protein